METSLREGGFTVGGKDCATTLKGNDRSFRDFIVRTMRYKYDRAV
jgi:hypothetical protein